MSEKRLIHTVEAIDYKLNLINKNKNLLPYPYEGSFPAGFTDMGDGSILVDANTFSTSSSINLKLNNCELSAGKRYIISIEVVDFINNNIVENNDAFHLSFDIYDGTTTTTGDLVSNYTVIDLRDKTTEVICEIRLHEYSVDTPNQTVVLRPQVEEVQVDNEIENESLEKTTWVPYMKTIGSYVDARFNSTNAKIKVLNDELTDIKNNNSSGSISNVFILSSDTPEDTDDNKKLLWIDTNPTTGGLKYYKEGEGWVTVPVRFS